MISDIIFQTIGYCFHTQFVKSILRDNLEDSNEFKVQCIKNQCEDCGDLHKFFEMQIENINESTPVSWLRYEYETYQNKTGDESRKNCIEGE